MLLIRWYPVGYGLSNGETVNSDLLQGFYLRDFLVEPVNGQVIGREESEVGEIEVVKVTDMMTIAKIVRKAGTIARGDLAKAAKH